MKSFPKMPPKVSIILTTHGDAPYLKQAIGSVLAQTFEDWELVIAVDKAETKFPNIAFSAWHFDDAEIAHDRFKIVELVVPEGVQCRFASTINQAFKHCKGEFITYLCHDDLYLPWRLGCMLNHFSVFDIHDVCFGYQKLISEIPITPLFSTVGVVDEIRKGSEDQPAGSVDHSSVMHRRECFEKVGGWDENAPMRYGDAYFWGRLQNAGYRFHCIPEVLDIHRFNQESISWKLDHPENA